ncbi:MAG: acyl-CoA thioesterase [Bacteriovoracaceae bacterium]
MLKFLAIWYLEAMKYETKVRKEHIDSLGHMNHAQYLEMFEAARWATLEEYELRGMTLTKYLMEHLKYGPVILNANISYKKELILDEKVFITTKYSEGRRSFLLSIYQEMFNEKNELAAVGEYVMSFMDLRERKVVKLPDEIKSLIY